MYLELADHGNNNMYLSQNDTLMLQDNEMYLSQANTDEAYVYVPSLNNGAGGYLREDYFDPLPQTEFNQVMDYLDTVQPGMSLFGLGKAGRERRSGRRTIRRDTKQKKIDTRAETRRTTGGIGGALAGLVTAAKEITGKGAPQTSEYFDPAYTPSSLFSGVVGGDSSGVMLRQAQAMQEAEIKAKEEKEAEDKKKRNQLYIGGGLGLAALVAVVVVTRGGKGKKSNNGN